MSMKAKLGQNPNQNKTFVPGAPSNNRTGPSTPSNQAPSTPTK
jgi:hypothetical protein